MPQLRSNATLIGSGCFIFHARLLALPPEVRAVVDPDDPALDYVVDALTAMRTVGFDMSDPAMLAAGVDAGQRKAAQFAAALGSGEFAREQAANREEIERGERFLDRRQASLVVYYARLGNRCKIGYTTDLKRRMSNIQPEELLLTEPGGEITEAERHAQFAHLHVVGEWFRYEGSLVEHVESLR